MEFTKQNLVKTAVLGSAIIGAVTLAVPASATSPGPSNYRGDDHVAVSYNDATNQFCASMETAAGGVLPAFLKILKDQKYASCPRVVTVVRPASLTLTQERRSASVWRDGRG